MPKMFSPFLFVMTNVVFTDLLCYLFDYSATLLHYGRQKLDQTTNRLSPSEINAFIHQIIRCHWKSVFRSTPPSWPNEVGLKYPSVRPQNVSSISMKFGMYVEDDEWCMMVCSMTRSKVKVKVTSLWKSKIRPFSKAISSPILNGGWQMTTDS